MHGALKSRCSKMEACNAAPILAAPVTIIAADDDIEVLSMTGKKMSREGFLVGIGIRQQFRTTVFIDQAKL